MLTLTDIFAGAGGSSTGSASIPGVEVAIAAGNAVTPPAARDLVAVVAESITGEPLAVAA